MRRVLPWGIALALIIGGCATGGSTTGNGFGNDDGGGTGDGGSGDASMAADSGEGGMADSGPLKTCVHNDDCTAPSICTGTNGQACMGGFCVPTGKPQSCDDGVACTSDSCDANANKCKHTPNDAACPNGSYCDPVMSCVQTLPCMTMGDTVCDRLDTTPCDGLWSCDTVRKYCVHAPKPCTDRPNATTTCTVMGQTATCSWACQTGYVDVAGDLNTMGDTDGCDCHITDAVDKPTLANVDGNCDGIVGNKAQAIFVDGVSGNDANAGTMAMPKRTVAGGIAAALAANPVKDVYVSKGTYSESVSMADGVSIYGGYDASNNWARTLATVTTIASPTPTGAVTAHSLALPVEIQLFTITSPDGMGTMMNGDGMSSYGVVAVSCTGGVTVRGCTITTGRGASGAAGSAGSQGGPGGQGAGASGTGHGPGGTGCNGANGGQGGDGVGCTGPGNPGIVGTAGGSGGTPGQPGSGGNSGGCSTTSSSDGFPANPVTSVPGSGFPGANGNAGPSFGAFDVTGLYVAAPGGDGLGAGNAGGGGGGGGSGGGTAHGTNFICTNCSCLASGGGGGGGGGGCGGGVGRGGRGGGGSFGIVAVSTTMTIDSNKTSTGSGGAGGNGGNGGGGGAGGPPGGGAGGQQGSGGCSTRTAGSGAAGAAGGAGGQGGGAAGGSGGPSVCILYKGTSPTAMNNQCTLGGAGSGGTGGGNGQTSAQNGIAGLAMDTYNSP